MQLAREASFDERLEPEAICVRTVPARRFKGGFSASDLDLGEVEFLRGHRESGIPDHAFLASDQLALECDSLLFVGGEGNLVLDRPDCLDGGDIATLGTEEGMEIETLDVVELDLRGFV